MSISQRVRDLVEAVVENEIVASASISGGCINQVYFIEFANSERAVLKINTEAPDGFFEAEANGLRKLASSEAVRVPRVLFVEDSASLLLIEAMVESDSVARDYSKLGRDLAALHRVTSQKFGLDSDNFIGKLNQTNTVSNSWGEFFYKYRLLAQANVGIEIGWMSKSTLRTLKQAKAEIYTLLDEPEQAPSLVHGDLWSGNVLWSDEGPVLIDPALYYGSREVDIAFTEMFGGFDKDFYLAYQEEFPLSPRYEERREVLNLYHLLTHANMFGGHYIQQAETVIRTL